MVVLSITSYSEALGVISRVFSIPRKFLGNTHYAYLAYCSQVLSPHRGGALETDLYKFLSFLVGNSEENLSNHFSGCSTWKDLETENTISLDYPPLTFFLKDN